MQVCVDPAGRVPYSRQHGPEEKHRPATCWPRHGIPKTKRPAAPPGRPGRTRRPLPGESRRPRARPRGCGCRPPFRHFRGTRQTTPPTRLVCPLRPPRLHPSRWPAPRAALRSLPRAFRGPAGCRARGCRRPPRHPRSAPHTQPSPRGDPRRIAGARPVCHLRATRASVYHRLAPGQLLPILSRASGRRAPNPPATAGGWPLRLVWPTRRPVHGWPPHRASHVLLPETPHLFAGKWSPARWGQPPQRQPQLPSPTRRWAGDSRVPSPRQQGVHQKRPHPSQV